MANYTQADLAYAAGIIDGEGYIGITVHEADKRRVTSSPSFQAVVSVGMTDPEVILWLQGLFGGNVYSYEPRADRRRGVHHWRLGGPGAAEFCRLIRPYLRLKHRQAELLVGYREDSRLDHTRHGGRGSCVPDGEIEIKRTYVSGVRALNQREVA